jgi:hypothetical protein
MPGGKVKAVAAAEVVVGSGVDNYKQIERCKGDLAADVGAEREPLVHCGRLQPCPVDPSFWRKFDAGLGILAAAPNPSKSIVS